jgi:hypothetical protein
VLDGLEGGVDVVDVAEALLQLGRRSDEHREVEREHFGEHFRGVTELLVENPKRVHLLDVARRNIPQTIHVLAGSKDSAPGEARDVFVAGTLGGKEEKRPEKLPRARELARAQGGDERSA